MQARGRVRSPSPQGPSTGTGLTRRSALLLPLLLAACAGEEPQYFPPLRFTDLPPIRLNVASIQIEQHFIPSGMKPDVTQFDPDPPADALQAMARDRLKAFGTAGHAVFEIQDASLVRHGDTISGTMDVVLNVYPAENAPRVGFAEARVTRQFTGDLDNLRARLYDLTKAMMHAMNIEFEYQVQNRLHDWVASGTATVPTVQQQPLNGAGQPGAQPSTGAEAPPLPPASNVPPMPTPMPPTGTLPRPTPLNPR